jgi:hypothetical protein
MNHNQTAPDSLHPPVIAGVPTGGESRGFFDAMENCVHTNKELRKLSHCNQIKYQCLDCGESVGNPIKHSEITVALSEIEDFDLEFRDLMRNRAAENRKREAESRRADWTAGRQGRVEDYAEYIKSPQWRAKRNMVIQREGDLCQGCRSARIDEVHHETYANRGDELLFQLIGLCSSCHRKAHKS